jgi:hypothetical protein
MMNRIRHITIVGERLDPYLARLELEVLADRVDESPRISGYLDGPRSTYAVTVEATYPVRLLRRLDSARLLVGISIPEPCLWRPDTPLVYEGHLALEQENELPCRALIHHAFRNVRLTENGLCLNGEVVAVRGLSIRHDVYEPSLIELRNRGFNAVLVRERWAAIQYACDRAGLFLFERAATLPADGDGCILRPSGSFETARAPDDRLSAHGTIIRIFSDSARSRAAEWNGPALLRRKFNAHRDLDLSGDGVIGVIYDDDTGDNS